MKNFISCITCRWLRALCAGATGALSCSTSVIDLYPHLQPNRFQSRKPATEQTQEYVDSTRRVISEFYYDQFRWATFRTPRAPYFMLGQDFRLRKWVSEAAYACAHTTIGAEPYPQSGFAPYLIPRHLADRSTCATSAPLLPGSERSSLLPRGLAASRAPGELSAVYRGQLSTAMKPRRLAKALQQPCINNFTAGVRCAASSTRICSHCVTCPQSMRGRHCITGKTFTAVLVRYMTVIKDRWVLAVSGESPESSIDADNINTAKVSNWMPDWATFVQYQWGKGEHVRLSGIARTLSYRDLIAGRNHNIVGWGRTAQLGGASPPSLTTYVTASYGHGSPAGLGGDLLIGSYDLTGRYKKAGTDVRPASFAVGVRPPSITSDPICL